MNKYAYHYIDYGRYQLHGIQRLSPRFSTHRTFASTYIRGMNRDSDCGLNVDQLKYIAEAAGFYQPAKHKEYTKRNIKK